MCQPTVSILPSFRLLMNKTSPTWYKSKQSFLVYYSNFYSRNFANCFQMVSLDFSQKLPFRLKHSHLHPCKLNNIVFEICYVSAIKDSSSCRNVVSNSKDLNWSSRGRGFVISSGAEDPLFIRGNFLR